ncbi:response regulator transcription factor [Sansalvadorimonas verongulae]|uniref:response regulator transcription factor n=1 Tax=Sansalvadorimonas verongulae TaxID=2172824 RepID=UPI0012BC6DB3|nr:LuxR C-terminal-related transcriptional regulator [Sansalvadorimonas verongulae]MTI12362.1 hypothetical protein [Sansalvadorimonas verongulae]
MQTLTPKQKQSLQLAASGLCHKGTAREMGCSPHTVRRHWEQARERLESKSMVHAVAIAISRGIIAPLCLLLSIVQVIGLGTTQTETPVRQPVRTSVRLVRTTRVGRKYVAGIKA